MYKQYSYVSCCSKQNRNDRICKKLIFWKCNAVIDFNFTTKEKVGTGKIENLIDNCLRANYIYFCFEKNSLMEENGLFLGARQNTTTFRFCVFWFRLPLRAPLRWRKQVGVEWGKYMLWLSVCLGCSDLWLRRAGYDCHERGRTPKVLFWLKCLILQKIIRGQDFLGESKKNAGLIWVKPFHAPPCPCMSLHAHWLLWNAIIEHKKPNKLQMSTLMKMKAKQIRAAWYLSAMIITFLFQNHCWCAIFF